jgi:hypothetical protein
MIKDPRIDRAIDHLDILSVLDEFNVDYVMDGKNVGVGYVGVRPCPFCGDSRNHWGVNINGKFGTCFKCKEYMSTFRLISFYGRMSFQETKEYLLDKEEYDIDIVSQVNEIINSKKKDRKYIPPKKDPLPPDTKLITYNFLRNNTYLRNFFKERKLYYWDIKRYGLMYHDRSIIFPVFLRRKIVAWQKRDILNKWYHNSSNLGEYICFEDRIIEYKPLILVEGFLDYSRVDSFIRTYYNKQVSITTGYLKMVSNNQIKRIINKNPSKVIVMFDNDSWFDYDRIKKVVPFDVDFVILPKEKDPNDLSWSELKEIFKEIL